MLDKLSNAILDFMLDYSDNPADFCYDFDKDLDEMAEALSCDREAIRASLDYLNKNEYIKYEYINGTLWQFSLDYKGAHKREFARLETKERWKERIWGFISGVLVAVLAGLIIALLS